MEFKKCTRCGSFYISEGYVCPRCSSKDNREFSTFKNYIAENGLGDNLDIVSSETGISLKNINRFLGYPGMDNLGKNIGNNNNINLK